jgi:pantoate--beta-alanine ligase
MRIERSVAGLRATVTAWRRQGQAVALVPTMGALHPGHLSLLTIARRHCPRVIATIFVNPLQFGPQEDFARYPRQEQADRTMLAQAGCDLLYAPPAEQMYLAGFATSVAVAGLTTRWEGEFRPGHFDGVTTVVAKLMLQSGPDVACFGEKDYQQLRVVERMVRDLDIPVRILGCPTIREADGLALSSRNAQLSVGERAVAPALHRALLEIATAAERNSALSPVIEAARNDLLRVGFAAVDYLAVVDAETLEPMENAARPARAIGAARLGRVRLIDNVPIVSRG